MLALIGKTLLALFEHELVKEEPEIQDYLVEELNSLASDLEKYVSEKLGTNYHIKD